MFLRSKNFLGSELGRFLSSIQTIPKLDKQDVLWVRSSSSAFGAFVLKPTGDLLNAIFYAFATDFLEILSVRLDAYMGIQ